MLAQFLAELNKLEGKLVIQKALTAAQGKVSFAPPVLENPINYSGLSAE